MKLEDHIKALITQYQQLQQRHKIHAVNACYKVQADMWQAMADDFSIIVEDLQQALYNADDVKLVEQPEPKKSDVWHNVDPRKTAPAGKWCADATADAAIGIVREARNNYASICKPARPKYTGPSIAEMDAEAIGKDSIAVANGAHSKARGSMGCYLVLTEYDDDDNFLWAKMAQVDGSTIKEKVWYTLKNGEFVETKP